MKSCRKCGIEQPLVDFPKVPGCTDGHSWTCKSCVLHKNRERKLQQRPLETRPRYQAKLLFEQGMKKCSKCDEVKPLDEFVKCVKRFTTEGGYKANCKYCDHARNRAWRMGHKEHLAEYHARYSQKDEVRQRKLQTKRRISAKSPRQVMQITLRHGLQRFPTENPATIDDLMAKFEGNQGRCALTGITMTWAKGTVLPTSISLDRIDPNQGYSDDNLRLVCHAINAFKGRMTDHDMFSMALALIGNMQKPKLRLVS